MINLELSTVLTIVRNISTMKELFGEQTIRKWMTGIERIGIWKVEPLVLQVT